jgi:hypothetical protein
MAKIKKINSIKLRSYTLTPVGGNQFKLSQSIRNDYGDIKTESYGIDDKKNIYKAIMSQDFQIKKIISATLNIDPNNIDPDTLEGYLGQIVDSSAKQKLGYSEEYSIYSEGDE